MCELTLEERVRGCTSHGGVDIMNYFFELKGILGSTEARLQMIRKLQDLKITDAEALILHDRWHNRNFINYSHGPFMHHSTKAECIFVLQQELDFWGLTYPVPEEEVNQFLDLNTVKK
jgi:hypothetical protein